VTAKKRRDFALFTPVEWRRFREEYIKNILRLHSISWPAERLCLVKARTERRINPETGRLAWRVRCAGCLQEFLEKEVAKDHKQPVVPVERDMSLRPYGPEMLGGLVARMLPGPEDLQVLCFSCHSAKTEAEQEARARR
jgi:hypothetical protein